MKLKKLISLLSAMAIVTVSAAAYTGDNNSVCAYGETISLSNDLYIASVTRSKYQDIRLDTKNLMSWGIFFNFHVNGNIDEVLIPSVIEAESEYENDIAVMELDLIDCDKIKSLILPDTMMKLDMSQLINTQDLEFLTIPSNITAVINDKELDSKNKYAIRGNIGSFAEKYAKDNDIPFIASGDIDFDSNYSKTDIDKMKEYMYGKSEMELNAEKSADLNFDQELNIVDYIMLKNTVSDPPFSSCGASTADALAVPDMGTVKSHPFEKSQMSGYESFIVDSSDEILLDSDSKNANPVYSPFSIYSALAMAAECASGNTQKEILDALHADSIDSLRSDHTALFGSLYFDDFSEYCRISNSLWLNDRYKFKQDTLENIAKYYYAPSFSRYFPPDSFFQEISDWIFKNTSGKISPVVPVDQFDIMKIINTVTFKNKWISTFRTSEKDTFTLSDLTTKECDFLKSDSDEEEIGFSDNFMKYSLRMQKGYNMNFILPDEDVSVEEIIADSETMEKIFSDDLVYQKRKLFFKVPKFNVYSQYDVIPAAKKLGIIDAFDKYKCDFNEVIDYKENDIDQAYINLFSHDATLLIDENGCEAAAYTIISLMYPTCMPPENEPVYFYLDRPFFYYITNQNDIPVFSGIIYDPTQK